MRIYLLTSSRADFGIYQPLIAKLKADPAFDLRLVVFGTHLDRNHGYTYNAIEAAGFQAYEKLETSPTGDQPFDIAKNMSLVISAFADFYNKELSEIDLLLCLGDRYEMFAAVSASVPFNIRVGHFHGGETTEGAIDEAFRHSITAMSDIHFTSTAKSAERVAAIKGSSDNVFAVGALSLDNLKSVKLLNAEEFAGKFGVFPEKPILVSFHPETVDYRNNEHFTNELIEALNQVKQQIFITMPNADTMGNMIRKKLSAFAESRDNVYTFESLGTQGYFSAMNLCDFLIGNSSSGIIEAQSFGKYVINLGRRQAGRERGNNVIDCDFDFREITARMREISSLPSLSHSNIYGDGTASDRVIAILKRENK